MDIYDNISPIDFRYYSQNKELYEKLHPYLSENAFVKYQLKVEAAVTRALADFKICSKEAAEEVENACNKVTAQEVYDEDKRIKHYTRALVNCIRNKVSDSAKPYVHFTTTSFDIFDTANAMRFKEVTLNIVVPELLKLEKTLIELALREKATLQVGRTHGQHAVPITFGFAMSEYVSRLGRRIKKIKEDANELRGKISGAVGAYNAPSLFFDAPEEFEIAVLKKLNLKPSTQSKQIVEPEFLTDLMHSIISTYSVIANLADDMRHLQRSEIGEVAEKFEEKQVGSSTMPHKRNPWNFENIKSLYKTFMPRMVTVYLDQISEHQRDLSNSASSRFMPEIIAGFLESVARINGLMSKLIVDKINLEKNFNMNKEMLIAEPLYILLASNGHPDAHEAVRELTLESQKTKKPLKELVLKDNKLKPYIAKFSKKQIDIINNSQKYTGIAEKKAESVCKYWKKELGIYNGGHNL